MFAIYAWSEPRVIISVGTLILSLWIPCAQAVVQYAMGYQRSPSGNVWPIQRQTVAVRDLNGHSLGCLIGNGQSNTHKCLHFAPRNNPNIQIGHQIMDDAVNIRYSRSDSISASESRTLLQKHFPNEPTAIDNGAEVVNLLRQKKSEAQAKRALTYVGTRGASYCLFNPPKMTVAYTVIDKLPVQLVVKFEPNLKKLPPIVACSAILYVIKSIDVDKRIIHVEAMPRDWIIGGTG